MRKIAWILAAVMMIGCLSACSEEEGNQTSGAGSTSGVKPSNNRCV